MSEHATGASAARGSVQITVPWTHELHERLTDAAFWLRRTKADLIQEATDKTAGRDDLPELPPWTSDHASRQIEALSTHHARPSSGTIAEALGHLRLMVDAPEDAQQLARRIWAWLLDLKAQRVDVPEWFLGGLVKEPGAWFPSDLWRYHAQPPYRAEVCVLPRGERVLLQALMVLHETLGYPPPQSDVQAYLDQLPRPPDEPVATLLRRLVNKGYAALPYGEQGAPVALRTPDNAGVQTRVMRYRESEAYAAWRTNPLQPAPWDEPPAKTHVRLVVHKARAACVALRAMALQRPMHITMAMMFSEILTRWLDEHEGAALVEVARVHPPSGFEEDDTVSNMPVSRALAERWFAALGWTSERGLSDEVLTLAYAAVILGERSHDPQRWPRIR